MMDEALIDEVAQHGVIFNRQKYYLNGSNSGGSVKYETKDEAWQIIAMKLRTDVETCKKRWKYLRERYVSQRKQGDPPVYEHLSRPYLEKMKFLDQHIQPRKSYRNVPNFLTSPHSANSSNYSEYNMDSKSNGSMKGNLGHYVNSAPHHYQQDQPHSMNALSSAAAAASAMEGGSLVKIEADQVFREFAAAVASQQLQHISQSQMQHHTGPIGDDTGQSYQEHYRDHNADINNIVHAPSHTNNDNNGNGAIAITGVPSSSSSMKSPLSSPLPSVNGTDNSAVHTSNSHHSHTVNVSGQVHSHSFSESNNQNMETEAVGSLNMKKPRVQLNSTTNHMHNSITPQFADDTDEDSDDNSPGLLQPQTILNEHQENNYNTGASTSNAAIQRNNGSTTSNGQQIQQNSLTSNTDFLYQLYQQLPHQQQSSTQQNFNKFNSPQNQLTQRSSEQLLGELVTTELLKMTKEKRKNVQKRILEILFFDD